MKAAVMTKIKAPWEIKNLPDPQPSERQVVIKIHASGLCGTDAHIYNGFFPVPVPIVVGHEPVGEIVRIGSGVTDLKVGDRVGVSWNQKGCGRCIYCQKHDMNDCNGKPEGPETWINMGGGNSELMLAWADGCTLLPKNLSYELAAPLFCAGFTIASGYFNANPIPGERIAILGLGGLGHLAIQYAKAKGHPVLVITSSEDKIPLAKQLGADEVVIAKDHAGKALAKAGGANIILNTSNSNKLASQSLEGLLPEGRLVTMGIDNEKIELSSMDMILKRLRIVGSGQNKRSDLVDILYLAAEGKVKPIIEVYRLEQINEALQRLINGKVRFRAVIGMS
jgi:D-arabinose 1-dehydrogenase-like Zn-dependent alcohol dehydrogenase